MSFLFRGVPLTLLSASLLKANPLLSCLSTYRWAFIKQILLKQRAYLCILTSKNCPKEFSNHSIWLQPFFFFNHNKHVSSSAIGAYSYANTEAFAGLDQGENMLPDKMRCSNNRHVPTSAEPRLQRGTQSIQHPWTPPPRETNGRSESSNERFWQAASCTSLTGIITTACRSGYKTPKSLWAPFWPFVLSSPISQVPRHYMVNLAEPSMGWKSVFLNKRKLE